MQLQTSGPVYQEGYDGETDEYPINQEMEPGKEYEFPVSDAEDDSQLRLPILPGKKVVVELTCDSDIECVVPETHSTDVILLQSVAIFNELALTSDGPNYRFEESFYPADLPWGLIEVVEATPREFLEEYVFPNEDPIAYKAMMDNIRGPDLRANLEYICKFLDHMNVGDSAGNVGHADPRRLMEGIISRRGFEGDCKAFATLAVVLSYGIGLCARKVSGFVDYVETYEDRKARIEGDIGKLTGEIALKRARDNDHGADLLSKTLSQKERQLRELSPEDANSHMGHCWSEVYVPLNGGQWVLLDAARNKIGGYPVEKERYIVDCALPRITDPSVETFKLKVEYQDT